MKKDLYKVLGITAEAPDREVQRAWLKAARRLHPDVNPGDRRAAARYREAQAAWHILSSPSSRERYDRTGSLGEPPASGRPEGRARAPESRGWERIFRDVLHDEGEGAAGSEAHRGEDVHQVLEISFRESLEGARKDVIYQRESACRTCRGSRYAPDSEILPCPDCRGGGLVHVQRGPYRVRKICRRCAGAGEVGSSPCAVCGGKGKVLTKEKKNVTVPPGSDSGGRITVAGGGQPGTGEGGRGDLVVTLRVLAHPHLERKGHNLFTSVPVTVAEAALGATVLVPAARKKLSLRIPAGTQGGQQFRIRGRGIPHPDGTRGGDLYVTVMVVIPEAKDAKSRRLFRELEKIFPDNPRVQA
jgi:molecular chaperone DnaJ